MATKKEFVASGQSHAEVERALGVDYLMYLDREAMNAAARAGNPKIEKFCNACFTGEYPTGDITLERLQAIEGDRVANRDEVSCAG
jgi:amidophosphoribosyltransferase